MKKSLWATALLSTFMGSVSAQSSVTLYGVVDLSVQHLRSGKSSPLAGDDLTRLSEGHTYGPGSRWGLRVSEDLGAGLKANVVMESGIAADTGASVQGGRLFGRQAFISLASASAGEIRLGRQYILHDETMALSNPFSNTTLLNPGANANTMSSGSLPLFIDAPRIDNAVQYISPTFGGLRLQAMVAAGEGTADRYHGLKGVYGNGPFNAALSYEQSKARVATAGVAAAGAAVNKITELSANYDFGMFKLLGGYQLGKDLTAGNPNTAPNTGGVGTQIISLTLPAAAAPGFGAITELRAYTVGVAVPVGAATVGVNYTRAKYENVAGADRTLGRVGVVGSYALSKQTTAYAGMAVHNGDLKEFINEKTIFQVGLRKAF